MNCEQVLLVYMLDHHMTLYGPDFKSSFLGHCHYCTVEGVVHSYVAMAATVSMFCGDFNDDHNKLTKPKY